MIQHKKEKLGMLMGKIDASLKASSANLTFTYKNRCSNKIIVVPLHIVGNDMS
jgi:hypothetical protein